MFELRTLGNLDLVDCSDGHQVLSVLAQPKRTAFLTYLAVATPRGMHRRDTLVGIFWPDSSDKKARNTLNQTVFVLRRTFGQKSFIVNGETGIRLDPDCLRCDVWDFEAALACREREEALDLYRGNFLEGFFLSGCLEFERWVDSERNRLRDLATGAVLSLSQEMEDVGNPVGAVGWLRRAREWAPFDELVLRRQVELLLGLGDRSGAVREYETFARRLSVDLGMEPSEEIGRLLERPGGDVRTWEGVDEGKELSEAADSLGLRSTSNEKRRFTRSQTVAFALFSAAVGVVGAILGQRIWSPANSSENSAAPEPSPTSDLRTVAVLPFENTTGRPDLDDLGELAAIEIGRQLTSTGLFTVGLAGGPQAEIGLAPPRSSSGGQAGRPVPPSSDPHFVVTGSYSVVGGQLVFWPRVVDADAGTIAAAIDTVMGSIAVADEVANRLKDRVAGAMAMAVHPWLLELTLLTSLPPSYEAYLALARGVDLGRDQTSSGFETALERLDSMNAAFFRAAAFDSGFTLPLVMLHYWWWGWEGYEEHLLSLQQRRDELPRWERAALDFQVARESGNQEGVYKAAGELARMNPSADRIRVLATACLHTNRPREALELLESLDPNHAWEETSPSYWLYRAMAHQRLGEHEAALEVVDRGRGPLGPNATLDRIEILSLVRLGRVKEATDRAVEALESARETVSPSRLADISGIFWLHGLDEATDRVVPVALNRLSQRGIVDGVHVARILVQGGRYEEARRLLGNPEDLPREGREALDAFRLLAYMAAREGDAEGATRLALTAETVSVRPRALGKMVRAEVAAHLGDRARATRLLQEAYTHGIGGLSVTGPNPLDLSPLQGYEPFEDLIRPKG